MNERVRIRRRRAVAGLAGLVVVVVLLVLLLSGGGSPRLAPAAGGAGGTFDPLGFTADRSAEFEAAAAAGLSHVLYAKSPGGIVASAQRTAGFRPAVEAAARSGPIDAGTLEAIVLLESAGRQDIVAGPHADAASGLTQILAATGRDLLGMSVNVAAADRLIKQLTSALAAHRSAAVATLRARLARADQRFDPQAALAATERYVAIAKRTFGRDDLAVVSYHMGIGNLESVLRLYAGAPAGEPIARVVSDNSLSYAKLYFDSTPIHHAAAYSLLSRFGDDSATYYWRVLAARQLMSLYRSDPAALARQAGLQAGASAARVLRPPGTQTFADAAAIASAASSGVLVAPPPAAQAARLGLLVDGQPVLRPEALAVAEYIAVGVRDIGGATAPLELTAGTTPGSAGYTFEIARRYASPAQALAFQFMLDRLSVLNVIAWQRAGQLIEITAGPQAATLRAVLVKAR